VPGQNSTVYKCHIFFIHWRQYSNPSSSPRQGWGGRCHLP
jgi:hypothetical protein